jgi:putative ABC transport system permease protein
MRSGIGAKRPLVLTHFPPIFAAIAAAAAILAGAASAAPLFRSATGTASVRIGIGDRAGQALVVTEDDPLAADVLDLRDQQLRASAATVEGLAAPSETISGGSVVLRDASAGPEAEVRLATRTGAAAHVQALGGDVGNPGLWLPQDLADSMDVAVGDPVTIAQGRRQVTATVAALYAASRQDPYWASLFATVGGDNEPGDLVLMDRPGFLAAETELEDTGRQTWTFGLTPEATEGLTIVQAGDLADGISALDKESGDPATQLGSVMGDPKVESPIVAVVRAAEAGQRTITPPIQTLALTGELAALFGMIAGGVYGVRRRRIEMRSLDAKGITWLAMGSRSAVEAVLPVLAGGIVGWLATWFAIRRFGPSDLIDPGSLRASIVDAAVPLIIAIAILAVVATIAGRRQAHEAAGGATAARSGAGVWWEVPVLVLAAASLYEISTRGTSAVSFNAGDVQVDRLLLLFPVLFMAGCAGLVVRGLARLLLRVKGSSSWPVPLYLASRRVTTAPQVALLLVTASTLAIGVLAYAGIAVATIRTSTEDKVLVSTGAQIAAQAPGPLFPPPPDSGITTTNVMRLTFVAAGADGDTTVTVVGIEPDTFARTAFWDPAFSSQSLEDLMHDLGGGNTEPLPAVVVGGELSPADAKVRLAGYDLPLRVVGSASAFPGQGAGLVVVVSAPSLRTLLDEHGAQVALGGARYATWAKGPVGPTSAYLVSSGADPNTVVVAADRLQTPGFRALAWSFVFMELIGVVTAVVALIGLLLYLQARQRSRELSYALGRRMGLTAGAHRAAVAIEIAALLASAYVLGSLLALATAELIYRRLDPLPQLTPPPVLRTPFSLLGWIGLAIAICAGFGAWLVQRRAERANVGAVLRFAE